MGEIEVSEEDMKQAFRPFKTPIHILVSIIIGASLSKPPVTQVVRVGIAILLQH